MAGIGVDGRRLAERGVTGHVLDVATPSLPVAGPETARAGALYLLMRRLGRRADVPPRPASADRAVGAP